MSPLFLMTAFSLSGIEPMRFAEWSKKLISKVSGHDVRVPSVSAALGGHKQLQPYIHWHRKRGFTWFNESGPQSSWRPQVGPHLHSTRRVFNSRRGHLRIQKASKLLAAGEPHCGSIHRSPGPDSRPFRKAPSLL